MRIVVTIHCPKRLRLVLSLKRLLGHHHLVVGAPKNTSTLTRAQVWASAQTQNGCP